MADHLGVTTSTLYNWMEEHPEFMDAVTRRRAMADDMVEGSLYGSTLGYTRTLKEQKLDKDGCTHDLERDVHIPANPNAGLAWLKNRRPDTWREKREVEITGDFAQRVKEAAAALQLIDDEGE